MLGTIKGKHFLRCNICLKKPGIKFSCPEEALYYKLDNKWSVETVGDESYKIYIDICPECVKKAKNGKKAN